MAAGGVPSGIYHTCSAKARDPCALAGCTRSYAVSVCSSCVCVCVCVCACVRARARVCGVCVCVCVLVQEVSYIINHSESTIIFVEDR